MSILQWVLLIVAIAAVAGIYWVVRHQADRDPWRNMDEPGMDESGTDDPGEEKDPAEPDQAPTGDSYIVGVRTLSRDSPAARKAGRAVDAKDVEGSDANGQAVSQDHAQPAPVADPPPDGQRVASPAAQPQDDGEAHAGQRVSMRAQRPPEGEQDIFILHVASPNGQFFDGTDIHAALAAQDLKFGLNDIYHRVTETHGVTESVFSVANMLKPGTLDPIVQDRLVTPGLTMFLVLPAPLEGTRAMHDMLETANALAGALRGEVLDDKRALLTAQSAQYMLDRIAELDRRAQLARRR